MKIETEIGKPQGIQRSREYNEVIRIATMKWAMLEQIKVNIIYYLFIRKCNIIIVII